ncbi:hypothetical protein J2794_001607 [Paraburkholderia terricola]|uniref:hypothetical protein n=1 Tax=Paraburkholderia terricola TaxID=169427 RepID=UPI0028674984|nr:hypothetical protein [Paraburkholderia terricola]MDR6445516.1 hypothetical protein [Paraburkholderia terricola]
MLASERALAAPGHFREDRIGSSNEVLWPHTLGRFFCVPAQKVSANARTGRDANLAPKLRRKKGRMIDAKEEIHSLTMRSAMRRNRFANGSRGLFSIDGTE